jgi:hypothetical protein
MQQDYSNPSFFSETADMDFFPISWQELAKTVHNDNVDRGFWPADVMDRNVGEALCLIHSEVTEIFEASLSPEIFDDKVTDYPAFWVEVADAVIRVLDLGYAHGTEFDAAFIDSTAAGFAYDSQCSSMNDDLMEIHAAVDAVLELHRKRTTSAENGSLLYKSELAVVLGKLVGLMSKYSIPFEVIDAKLAYNRTRPYKHGKKY